VGMTSIAWNIANIFFTVIGLIGIFSIGWIFGYLIGTNKSTPPVLSKSKSLKDAKKSARRS